MSAVHRAPQRALSDFAELSRVVKRAGLLDRRRGYYLTRISTNIAALAVGCAAFVYLGDTWWQLLLAVYFAVVVTQLWLIGHDGGHKQIFSTKRANDAVGFAHGGLVGLSYGWWLGTHNRHHANPNHEDDDPDVNLAALAFTAGQSSTRRGFLRWMAKHQAFLFFPLLLLEGLNLHAASAHAVVRSEVKARRLEACLLLGHLAAYVTAVFVVMSPLTALVFIAVHQGLWGLYMGCSFAPNHKGMPVFAKHEKIDYLRLQVLTSRNIRGGRFTDLALGGLNYQIEHHLFPSMPRPSLRRVQSHVRAYCAQHGWKLATALPFSERSQKRLLMMA
jgi:fatty acid desaturase